MKRIGLLVGFLAALVFSLPTLTAQDEKKAKDKVTKKDDGKADEKKDPEKKSIKKEFEKMPAYGSSFRTKIQSVKADSTREFTVELMEQDPKKIAEVQAWQLQRMQQLGQQLAQINMTTDFNQRVSQMQNYQRDFATFQTDAAKRWTNIYSSKSYDVRAHEDAKVRTMYLPVMFDDQGFQKKWTEKEKAEFRGNTKIPGYPADFDAIRSGQTVDLYMVKKMANPKDAPKKKKGGPGDDPAPMVMERAEFILVVIYPDNEKK